MADNNPNEPVAEHKGNPQTIKFEEADYFKDYSSEMKDMISSEAASKKVEELKELGLSADEAAAYIKEQKTTISPEIAVTTDMLRVLSEEAGLEYVSISDYTINPKLLALLSADLARSYKIFPLKEEEDGTLLIAISDPLNITIVDDLRILTDRKIRPVVASESDIMEYIDQNYGVGDETIDDIVKELEEETQEDILKPRDGETDLSDLERIAHEPPVIKLVNLLLLQAIKDRASDLHIEPFSGMLRIRYRVDGVLREIPSPPKTLQLGLTSRLKVMSNMNISESRLPQDGRIRLTIQGREVDLRVSSVPSVHGESIVMRILDKSMMAIGIRQLGMTKETIEKLMKIVEKPNGIALVTGPTGSGKTTTLYAALGEINDPGDKIITTEDPVEYELPGIVQVNINSNVGLTFAACLRSILRQDPDVILVGEIRDLETGQIAIQAALTGHLVLSTLHTNSAAATITRLIDMGLEPFLLTSTLEGIIGQRLIRTICPSCKKIYTPTDIELEEFGVKREEITDITFYKGAGCDDCAFTGYKGRMGIFELLEVTEEIKELILERSTSDEIHALGISQGMETMRQDGWLKICLGITTFEEVARQTPKEDIEMIKKEMEKVIRKLEDKRRRERAELEKENYLEKLAAEQSAAQQPAASHPQPQPQPQAATPEQIIQKEAATQIHNIGDAQK